MAGIQAPVNGELLSRLEELVERLLRERSELLQRNGQLVAELDRLVADRSRVHRELGDVLVKLDRLEGRGR
jgi:hypothetical protein